MMVMVVVAAFANKVAQEPSAATSRRFALVPLPEFPPLATIYTCVPGVVPVQEYWPLMLKLPFESLVPGDAISAVEEDFRLAVPTV